MGNDKYKSMEPDPVYYIGTFNRTGLTARFVRETSPTEKTIVTPQAETIEELVLIVADLINKAREDGFRMKTADDWATKR